ncbi:protein-L-isoaspartate(D-aspartate) O-methyltransferase [Methylomicrobium lacus]|uniref:protein-L-isoaspartate(D-aspartate) O-methyltransferase n=1 Tax=Methylomicrobium lacus TaxID=136992 RepID=UPI00045E92D3|nr:protein-L-isoaspartate(D-aspartate) O-methyltransferase [Methylomicrobium lacus]
MKNIHHMLEDIRQEILLTAFLTGRKTLSPEVMEAIRDVPREQFVDPGMISLAFDNGPLPIGYGQTISQPFIVALMTDLLAIQPTDAILEIGTGSGYQTAILSLLAARVYTLEVIEDLSLEAADRFKKLAYQNIHARVGNGYEGWPEQAPYDGIIVTAAAPYVPDALIDQLKAGGRLVIPLGRPFGHQELIVLEKRAKGPHKISKILDVAFVPLVDHPKKWH